MIFNIEYDNVITVCEFIRCYRRKSGGRSVVEVDTTDTLVCLFTFHIHWVCNHLEVTDVTFACSPRMLNVSLLQLLYIEHNNKLTYRDRLVNEETLKSI